MWHFFKQSDSPKRINHLHGLLQTSFQNVKKDTFNIFQWLQFFHQKSQNYDQQIHHLATQISHLQKQKDLNHLRYELYSDLRHDLKPLISEEVRLNLGEFKEKNDKLVRQVVREAIDEYYLYHDLHSKLNLMQEQINQLKRSPIQEITSVEPLKQRIEALEQRKSTLKINLREKILKKITKNSKDYIKNLLVSMIHKYERISAYKLREMIVEEQGLCSKSSFYRILDEIEALSGISTVREGKEKTFFMELHAANESP
jgi:hypothetical protein